MPNLTGAKRSGPKETPTRLRPPVDVRDLPRPETIRRAILALENTQCPTILLRESHSNKYAWEQHRDSLVNRLYRELFRKRCHARSRRYYEA